MPNGFTDPEAVHFGQKNGPATTTTCLFAGGVNDWSGDPICFIGQPTNQEGGVSTAGVVGWGVNEGIGLVGWGGYDWGTGVVGLGGVSWAQWGPTAGQMAQAGGHGVVGAGGGGLAAYSVPDGGLASPIEAGWGVVGWGGTGSTAADVPKDATNVVPARPGVGVYGIGGAASNSSVWAPSADDGTGVIGLAGPDPGPSEYIITEGFGVVGGGPTGVYGYGVKWRNRH